MSPRRIASGLIAGATTADRRPWVALGFGLVHGFGFASVLRELGLPKAALGWSLFSFNLGVEIGQACIVGIAAPALVLLSRRDPARHRRVKWLGSWLVVLTGAWWFVERTLLFGR